MNAGRCRFLISTFTLLLLQLQQQPVLAQCDCCCDNGLSAIGAAGLAGLCPPGLLGATGLGGLGAAGLGGLGGLGRRRRQAVANCPHCGLQGRQPCGSSGGGASISAGAAGTSEIFHLNFDDMLVRQKVSTIAPVATGTEKTVDEGEHASNIGEQKCGAQEKFIHAAVD